MGALSDLALPPARLFIGGEWRDATGDGADTVVNPATEGLIGTVPWSSGVDADAAVAAARAAFDDGPWGRSDGRERAGRIRALQAALASRLDHLIELVVAETGTTLAVARSHQVTVPVIEHLGYWAEAAARPELRAKAPRVARRSDGSRWLGNWVVRREPVGVVAAITPFNFPLLLNLMKLGPALAMGNTVVLKPSPFTPFSALVLAEAVAEAGFPPGVVNLVTSGPEVGEVLTTDARVDMVTFTGSDVVGARIAAQAAPTLKRTLLELGGKSALIVRGDADVEAAATAGATDVSFHAGQGCALCTRHLVHVDVFHKYVELVADRFAKVRLGDPADSSTTMGPLIRRASVDRVAAAVEDAREAGATVVTGGQRPADRSVGFFYEPTLITGAGNDWPIAQEELFGPVGIVLPFETDDEAVRMANDSPYGLSGHIFSRDAGAAFELACRLRTGDVKLNGGPGAFSPDAPFGGYKRSGLGREFGDEGLDEYCQLKTIKYHAG
ncbi:MAG: aldehyde dehydrogenase family protein [Actinobacteria bacterium]|nr:aldehyde dehydrogenase family protein [Actinomycetota bacterium]